MTSKWVYLETIELYARNVTIRKVYTFGLPKKHGRPKYLKNISRVELMENLELSNTFAKSYCIVLSVLVLIQTKILAKKQHESTNVKDVF